MKLLETPLISLLSIVSIKIIDYLRTINQDLRLFSQTIIALLTIIYLIVKLYKLLHNDNKPTNRNKHTKRLHSTDS